jgi:sulfate transport system permease protein
VLESLRNPDLLAAARLGLLVAVISVLINTVFGVGIAIVLVRYRFPGRRLLSAVIDLPMSISPVVVGIALILVYGRTGWFGGWLQDHGIQIIFATPAMVLATVIVALPLVVREVIPVLEEAGTEQDQAAQSLGATAGQRFLRITLPTIKWALAYGVVLSLARSLGEFGAVRVVSGSVAGQSQTLTLFVNASYAELGRTAEQAAFTAAFVLMLVSVVFIIVIAWLRPKEQN